MNRELLVKVWIAILPLTGILFYFIATNSIFYPITFGIYSGIFFILHASILVLAIPISIIGIKRKIKFSKVLIILIPVFLVLCPLLFLTIYGGGPGIITTREQAIQVCTAQMQTVCQMDNEMPPTWNIHTITLKENRQIASCSQILNCSTCQECGFTP